MKQSQQIDYKVSVLLNALILIIPKNNQYKKGAETIKNRCDILKSFYCEEYFCEIHHEYYLLQCVD